MNSIRVRFNRGSEVKFISHLDLMKVFERALRRSGLPVAYSQGFNPHPQMVFGLPLSVGVTSEAEHADFEMSGDVSPSEFMKKMNEELPRGITITNAGYKLSKGNIMASVTWAVYDIIIFLKEIADIGTVEKAAADFLQKGAINARKEVKGTVKEIDIRPMIVKIDVKRVDVVPEGYDEFGRAFCLTAVLKAGSASNLKPELLVKSLAETTGPDIGAFVIHRKELYVDNGGKMADPMYDCSNRICDI